MNRRAFLVSLAALAACTVGSAPSEEGLYTCGMHPQVVQKGPGQCPICGMDLTPMGQGRSTGSAVYIDPGVQQHMGVRTAPVKRQPIFRHLRTLGEVDVAEDQVAVVNLRLSGWAERVRVDRTGDPVRAGQVLFDLYSPDLVAAQEEALLAAAQGRDGALFTAARRKLELYGIASRDIDAMLSRGASSRTLPIRAPRDGFVLHKDLREGSAVPAGRDLYRIGNLTRIWVTAEVYEHDAPWVQVGQKAQMELAFQKGRPLEGTVAYIYPTLTEGSRTLPVRLEFENPGIALKPGMFATVHIEYRRVDDALAIPTEAILHSGTRELVFVARGDGHFEAREISTGLEADHRMTEVLSGLREGDEVVISGQFLLDSESQLQEAVQKMMGGATEPEAPVEPQGYTCPMHPEVHSDGPGTCPKCGMFLVPVDGD